MMDFDEEKLIPNVQAIINNISFPKTIEDLRFFIYENGQFNVEDVEEESEGGYVEWTVPKWITVNDIVFFFHAKTAISRITHLETLLKSDEGIEDYEILMDSLQRARELYKKYGGKIFAVGRVLDRPFYDSPEDVKLPWKGKTYAKIGDIQMLDNPISIEEFSDFINVSRQSAITLVVGSDFDKLRAIIAEKNEIPAYLAHSIAAPMPLREINADNWLQLTQQYRRQFYLETQFRKFYVDYFMKSLGDKKSFYTECHCYKNGMPIGFADYGIQLNKKICFVEVKLDWDAEQNFFNQLQKYSYVDKVEVKKDAWEYASDIEQRYVLIIDTIRFGIFDAQKVDIIYCINLDDIKTAEDIISLKKCVKNIIFGEVVRL